MIYLFIVYGLAFVVLAIKRPKWALFLLCVFLPTYQIRFKIFGLPTTLLEVMIIILFIFWFVKVVKGQNSKAETTTRNLKIWNLGFEKLEFIWKSVIGNWRFLILAWLIVGLIAVFVSSHKIAAFGHWRAYFLEPILVLFILVDLVGHNTNLRMYLNDMNKIRANSCKFVIAGLAFSALICSVWAILQKWLGGGVWSTEVWGVPQAWRATGPFPQPNFLGLYLGPIIMLTIGQLIENWKLPRPKLGAAPGGKIKNWYRLLPTAYWLLTIIAGSIAIVLARSEGAILGILVGLIFLGIIYRKTRKWVAFILIILMFFVFVISIICVNSYSVLRQSAICASGTSTYVWQKITFQDLSSQLRINIWRGTWRLIKDRLIFGAGLRGYQQLIFQYQEPYYSPQTGQLISVETHPYPHNLFLAIWSELGIFGLIVFILIIFQFFKLGFKKATLKMQIRANDTNIVYGSKFLVYSLALSMIAILIHGLVDTPYFKNDLAVLFWLIIGLVIVDSSLEKMRYIFDTPKMPKIDIIREKKGQKSIIFNQCISSLCSKEVISTFGVKR